MFSTPRAIRGAIFLVVGTLSLQIQPFVAQVLSQSALWSGLSQIGLLLVAFICGCTGLYLLATRYKKT